VWSSVMSGTGCGWGEICNGGTCVTGCFISNVFYASGAMELGNPCESCRPTTSTTAWSNICGGSDGGIEAGSGCTIKGISYPTGTVNPMDQCQECNPANSPSSWSNVPLCVTDAGPVGTGAGTGS
jgi:hypothetical protein